SQLFIKQMLINPWAYVYLQLCDRRWTFEICQRKAHYPQGVTREAGLRGVKTRHKRRNLGRRLRGREQWIKNIRKCLQRKLVFALLELRPALHITRVLFEGRVSTGHYTL